MTATSLRAHADALGLLAADLTLEAARGISAPVTGFTDDPIAVTVDGRPVPVSREADAYSHQYLCFPTATATFRLSLLADADGRWYRSGTTGNQGPINTLDTAAGDWASNGLVAYHEARPVRLRIEPALVPILKGVRLDLAGGLTSPRGWTDVGANALTCERFSPSADTLGLDLASWGQRAGWDAILMGQAGQPTRWALTPRHVFLTPIGQMLEYYDARGVVTDRVKIVGAWIVLGDMQLVELERAVGWAACTCDLRHLTAGSEILAGSYPFQVMRLTMPGDYRGHTITVPLRNASGNSKAGDSGSPAYRNVSGKPCLIAQAATGNIYGWSGVSVPAVAGLLNEMMHGELEVVA